MLNTHLNLKWVKLLCQICTGESDSVSFFCYKNAEKLRCSLDQNMAIQKFSLTYKQFLKTSLHSYWKSMFCPYHAGHSEGDTARQQIKHLLAGCEGIIPSTVT